MQNMRNAGNAGLAVSPMIASKSGLFVPVHAIGEWKLVAKDKYGNIISEMDWENLVTTEGKNYLLSAGLDGGTQDTTWFVGLTDGTPTVAAGDTLASHAGWAEVSAYTGNRKAWTGGTAAAGSIDNVGNEAQFSINADSTTIGGAFLAAVDTGTAGILYAVGAFSGGDLILNNGSTLDITATFSV